MSSIHLAHVEGLSEGRVVERERVGDVNVGVGSGRRVRRHLIRPCLRDLSRMNEGTRHYWGIFMYS